MKSVFAYQVKFLLYGILHLFNIFVLRYAVEQMHEYEHPKVMELLSGKLCGESYVVTSYVVNIFIITPLPALDNGW